MKPKHLRMASILAFLTLLATTVMVAALPEPSFAGQKKLRIGHQVYPIHEQQLKWMKKWGEMNGVAIESVPISYGVFVEKLSASLMANSKEYDIICTTTTGVRSGVPSSSRWTTSRPSRA